MRTAIPRLLTATALLLALGAAPALATEVEPSHLRFDALYVVNGGDGQNGSITVVNADTARVAATFALRGAKWPHHVYLSPDRSRLAVAAPGVDLSGGHGEQPPPGVRGEVIVVNARSGAIINRATMPAINHNAIYSADGREIWTAQMMTGTVLVLDANTLQVKQEIRVGVMPHEVTLTPDGRHFYVANSMSGTVSVIDAATKTVVGTVAVGQRPVGAWQALNGYAYVDNEHSMTVSALHRRSLSVTTTFDLGFMPGMAQLGPDGHLWVTDSHHGRAVLYSLDTVARHHIDTGAGAHAIAFSADGRWAYITNQTADSVSVIDVHRRRVVRTLPTGVKPNGMVFRAAH